MASTQQSGAIVTRNGNGEQPTLQSLLIKMGPQLAKALPKHVNADRMSRIALTALNSTPQLANCTPASFLGAIIQAAQLGLEVNTPLGQAYLIPYKRVCQLIIGYQGMLDLARRSGLVKAIFAFPVYDGDKFSWTLGLDPTIDHVPSTDDDRATKNLTHVYAVAKLEGGEPIFTVLTRGDVEKYRRRSMAAHNGPWVTDFEAMALKTAIRRLFRWLPKSAEMATALALDEAPEHGRPQLDLVAPEVIAALTEGGVDVAAELAADAENAAAQAAEEAKPPVDPSLDGKRVRMPGSKNGAAAAPPAPAVTDAAPPAPATKPEDTGELPADQEPKAWSESKPAEAGK